MNLKRILMRMVVSALMALIVLMQSGCSDEVPAEVEITAGEDIKALKAQSESATTNAEITDAIQTLTDKRIAEIRNTSTTVEVSGTKYYVAADGNDDNDGLSPKKPWKTIEKVNAVALAEGDGVFFRRGDVFEGTLKAKSYVTYSAYGKGEKPRIYASTENSADPACWKATEASGVWEYAGSILFVAEPIDTKNPTYDVGNIVFDGSSNARKIYVSNEKDGTHLDYYHKAKNNENREFDSIEDFVDDLSFWYDSANAKLYLMCKAGNPGSLYEEIRIVPKANCVRIENGVNGVTIDNLHLAYGNYGVSAIAAKDVTVQNCEINWIGGCIQIAAGQYSKSRTYPTPHGNGIENYGNIKNFKVDNCYLWEIYDAAITGQRSNSGSKIIECSSENMQITNNVVEKSVYAIELFYSESEESYLKNTCIENNILRTAGAGFGSSARPDQNVEALIRNGPITANVTDYIVKNNIFDRSAKRIIQTRVNDGASKAMYYDNIYVQAKDAIFAHRNETTYYANDSLKESLMATGTEFNPTFIIVEELGYNK